MRNFNTGASRDDDFDKLDFEGFLSPLVLERYARYMKKHQKQSDGKIRPSDNWQKGIPKNVYMKSLWRHFLDIWCLHRQIKRWDKQRNEEITVTEALCAILFNTMGYLFEELKNPKDKERNFIEKGGNK